MANDAQKKVLKDRRFECQKCGYCCSHRAFIYPSLEEIQSLSRYLNISEWSFALRYLQEVYEPPVNAYVIAFKTNHPNDSMTGCIFCRENFCVIHDSSRTDLCHVFPWNHFNPERGEWEEDFVSQDGTFWCPGIGRGRVWTLEEIQSVRETYPKGGARIQRHYNPPPLSGPCSVDVPRPAGFSLTMSEERLIHKLRSLSIEKIRGVEHLVDYLYHGGYLMDHLLP